QESRLPPGSDFRRWVWITIAPFVTSGNWQVPLTGSHFIMFGVLSWVNRVSAVQELEQGFASVW
ncbi:hypothetical protein ACEZDU_12090, partial [Yersinia pestis]|uniref:hypothetical protein n=1 Tax=Yersinia pestis TaxID=632 RepID=UPI0035A84736